MGTNVNPLRIGKKQNSRGQRLLNIVHAQNKDLVKIAIAIYNLVKQKFKIPETRQHRLRSIEYQMTSDAPNPPNPSNK